MTNNPFQFTTRRKVYATFPTRKVLSKHFFRIQEKIFRAENHCSVSTAHLKGYNRTFYRDKLQNSLVYSCHIMELYLRASHTWHLKGVNEFLAGRLFILTQIFKSFKIDYKEAKFIMNKKNVAVKHLAYFFVT